MSGIDLEKKQKEKLERVPLAAPDMIEANLAKLTPRRAGAEEQELSV